MSTQLIPQELADFLRSQSEVNAAVARALQALTLQADRYDAELAELRDGLTALGRRIESVTRALPPHAQLLARREVPS